MRTIVFTKVFDEAMARISSQQVTAILGSPDKEVFLADGIEVEFADCICGIHTKTIGKTLRKRYSVIVITVPSDDGSIAVQAAFRLPHRLAEIKPSHSAVDVLKAFLSVFGVDVTLPGMGTGSLFLGGQMKVPETLAASHFI